MSKYNTIIDINTENSSHSLILGMVKPNSTVLEFGCAAGYMTEYMRDELGCSVFIIEFDKDSYNEAKEFSVDGFCGNIEDYLWVDAVKGNVFDYIMFADVLEHLTDPPKAIQMAIKFLKQDGRVLLSVPNIAHSSIIIDLLNNKFNYHSLGLLDNTHLKHFTYNTLREMLGHVGLTPIVERTTNLFPFTTEFANHYRDLPPEFQKILANKEFGTVYQFVFECAKSEYVLTNRESISVQRLVKDLRYSEILKIYVGHNDGKFDEHNTVEKPLYFGDNKVFIDLSDFNSNLCRVDFGDFSALVKIFAISINGESQDLSTVKGNFNTKIGNTIFFYHNDPYIYLENQSVISQISLEFSYEAVMYREIFDDTSTILMQKSEQLVVFNNERDTLTAERDSLAAERDSLTAERDSLAAERDSLTAERDSLAAERDSLAAERDSLAAERDSLAAERDTLVAELDNLIKSNENLVRELESARIYGGDNKALYDSIINSTSWKITKPAREFVAILRMLLLYFAHIFRYKKVIVSNPSVGEGIYYAIEKTDFKDTMYHICGWVFHKEKPLTNTALKIKSGDEIFNVAVLNILRPDVVDVYKNSFALNAGFETKVNLENFTEFTVSLVYTLDMAEQEIFIGQYHARYNSQLSYFLSRISYGNMIKGLKYLFSGRIGELKAMSRVKRINAASSDFVKISDLPNFIKEHALNLPSYNGVLKKIDIIIPVYNGYKYLERLFDTIGKTNVPFRIIVINDCSTDERVIDFIRSRLTAFNEAVIIENEANKGFVYSVNSGLSLVENDVVLLNTDVELPQNWAERLMRPIFENDYIASVTPFTNSGTISSFPKFIENNDLLFGLSVEEIDNAFHTMKPKYSEMPTGVGFCMGMSLKAIRSVGLFDESSFGRGYGEENDWCQRAIKSGYKNVLVENLFIYHNHGGSFDSEEKKSLCAQHLDKLNMKHPNYNTDVAKYIQMDVSADFRNYALMQLCNKTADSTVLFFDHNIGGGAAAYINFKKAKLLRNNICVMIIRYIIHRNCYLLEYEYIDQSGQWLIATHNDFQDVLQNFKIDEIFINSLVTYPDLYDVLHEIEQFHQKGVRLIYLLHDYFCVCPTINLVTHDACDCCATNRSHCDQCLKNNLFVQYPQYKSMELWYSNWQRFLCSCDKVIAFSQASTDAIVNWFDELPPIEIVPHTVDYLFNCYPKHTANDMLNIAIIGNISEIKGLNVVSEMGKIIDSEKLNMRIIVIGKTKFPVENKCVTVAGEYTVDELPSLLLKYTISIVFIPSIWRETFSFTTEEAIVMGYPVAVFNLGAPAERVKKYDKGLVISKIDARVALKEIESFIKNQIE